MQHRTNRRQFIKATAASSLGLSGASLTASEESDASISTPGGVPTVGGVARKYWIDPSIAAWPAGPWRKVHIEYHTSRHMPRLAERFNADEFGDQLVKAHVSGASIFAKDMYGYSYFPNTHGRMHPNLSFDLLGAQIASLRKRKIQVLAYYMLTWNPELADRHPEWLVVHEPGDKSGLNPGQATEDQKAFKNTLQPGGAGSAVSSPPSTPVEEKGYRPYLWQFCICQEGFVQGELDLIEELISKYPLDGIWLDGGSSPPCYCPACVRQLRAKGLDPFDAGVQYQHKWDLCLSFLERIRKVVKKARPGCLVCPQNQGSFYGLAKRAPLFDYSSQEALFTDAVHYGYHYFPTVIRYARGFGRPFHGCTVCFKDFWADFGGLKSPAQMHTEVAAYVSQGARCDIGDQVHPSGRLDPAVYHVIGLAYKDHGRRHERLPLMTIADNLRFSSHKQIKGKAAYDRYDNFDAIEVPFIDAIPSDYGGMMGVPVTFLDKYNPEQFEILGYEYSYDLHIRDYPVQIQVDRSGKRSNVTKLNDGCAIKLELPPTDETYYIVHEEYFVKPYKRLLIRRRAAPAVGTNE